MTGKLKAFLLLGVMYALGAVSGMAWQTYRNHHFSTRRTLFAERRIKHLEAQLHLTPPQEQAMRDIFEKAHERATEINEEVSWDLADIHRDSVEAIRRILTPDQEKQFEILHRKAHARGKSFLDNTPDGSPGLGSEVNS